MQKKVNPRKKRIDDMEKVKKKRTSFFADFLKQFKKNKLAVVGVFVILLLAIVAIFADYIAPYPYDQQDVTASFAGPSKEHPLGCDRLGRDYLSRLIYGSRESLKLGILASLLALVLGSTIGMLAGFFGGFIDDVLMRFIDVYQSIPTLLFCICISAVIGMGTGSATLAIGLVSAGSFARLLRASVMTTKYTEYVEAAKAIGAGKLRIMLKHILPNSLSPIIVQFTMKLGVCVQFGATMSYLGMGSQPPIPEWGTMLADGRNFMRQNPMLVMWPGICIMIAVLAFNRMGDGVRDAMDPRLRD